MAEPSDELAAMQAQANQITDEVLFAVHVLQFDKSSVEIKL